MTEDQEAIAVLIDGVTEFGITHAISANLARHVLAVLHDAGYAVEKLPQPSTVETIPTTQIRRATFGSVVASIYPGGMSQLTDGISAWAGDDPHHAVAVGLLAGARWVQEETSP